MQAGIWLFMPLWFCIYMFLGISIYQSFFVPDVSPSTVSSISHGFLIFGFFWMYVSFIVLTNSSQSSSGPCASSSVSSRAEYLFCTSIVKASSISATSYNKGLFYLPLDLSDFEFCTQHLVVATTVCTWMCSYIQERIPPSSWNKDVINLVSSAVTRTNPSTQPSWFVLEHCVTHQYIIANTKIHQTLPLLISCS